MSSGVRETQWLGGLPQDVILLGDHLLSTFTVVVGDDITDGCSRSIGSAIGMRLLGQVKWLILHLLDELWELISISPSESSLGPSGSGSSSQRQLVGLLKVLIIAWSI